MSWSRLATPPSRRDDGPTHGPDDPDIQAALEAWKVHGQAPVIRADEFAQYPGGLTEAVVARHPCDIEFEAGEGIMNVSPGDSTLWLASAAFSGDRPHILVKPTEFDIATNAMVATCAALLPRARVDHTDSATRTRRVNFYYPGDFVEQADGPFLTKAAQRGSRVFNDGTNVYIQMLTRR